MGGNMNQIQINLPTWDSVQYNTFSRSNVANYQATSSVCADSAIEVLRNSLLITETAAPATALLQITTIEEPQMV